MKSIITLSESQRLVELTKLIKRGQKTFIEVGTALAEIRDSKLYRSEYDTFEQYCQKEWGWNRRYAYNLIEASEVVNSLPENVQHAAQNVRQATELARVEPGKRVEVLEKAVATAQSENRDLTAKDIKNASPVVAVSPNPSDEWQDPDEVPEPQTDDQKLVAALGGIKSVESFESKKLQIPQISEDEKDLLVVAEAVWSDADMVIKDLATLEIDQLEAVDEALTEYRKLIRVVIKQRAKAK